MIADLHLPKTKVGNRDKACVASSSHANVRCDSPLLLAHSNQP